MASGAKRLLHCCLSADSDKGVASHISRYKNRLTYTPIDFGDITVSGLTEGIGSIEKMLVFGDISIDLTGSKLIPGKNHISASVLFGNITITVPDDFPVGVNLGCCAGDLLFKNKKSDGFLAGIRHKDDNYESVSAKLFINAKSCFGDIKVISISK